MRIVFIGASHFGLRCLNLIKNLPDCDVVGVVTAPKVFPISYRPEGLNNVLYADIGSYCADHGLESAEIQAGMNDPQLLAQVERWCPDVYVVSGWYHMVPSSWRSLAPAYGLHASLLPDYSGGAPLVWAIINGESETGISLFQLADGMDNGPLLGQACTEISAKDTIATLYARIEELGLNLLHEHLPALASGRAVLTEQDESQRRVVPQRSPDDGLIDWSWSASRVYDFVRAQTRPYPGAFSLLQGERVSIWAVSLVDHQVGFEPGHILLLADRVLVSCGDGETVEVTDGSVGDPPLNWLLSADSYDDRGLAFDN